MAEIITAKGTGFFIEKVIRGARERIVLISPYLKVQKLYLDELKSAAKRGVQVAVLFRKDEAKQEQVAALLEVQDIQLSCLAELHAKCYFNEHRFVLTSMNLHDHSERNNKELGIMLDASVDKELFRSAWDHATQIMATAQPFSRTGQRTAFAPASAAGAGKRSPIAAFVSGFTKGIKNGAYCIRCAERIPFDVDKPLCGSCYRQWAEWKNEDYKEDYCHDCGKERVTTFAKPLCRACYDRQ